MGAGGRDGEDHVKRVRDADVACGAKEGVGACARKEGCGAHEDVADNVESADEGE